MFPGINQDVVAFVMSRWQESGGFGFAPTLPASIEDTYHALRILETIRTVSERELGELKATPHLKRFVMRKEDKETWSLKTAYQYLALCSFCVASPDQGWLKRLLEKRLTGVVSFQERYYLARIRREFPSFVAGLPGRMNSEALLMGNGKVPDGAGPDCWRTAEELWIRLYLNRGAQKPLHRTKNSLIQWLQACQTPDGGFGGLPGTTSFIENTHCCLSALVLLGGAPLSPDMARGFILRCKTRGGGFARKNGAAPFLYSTWHAVASLDLLSDMEGYKDTSNSSEIEKG